MSEPLTDERLNAIRARFAWQRIDQSMEVTYAFRELIAEVERLKADRVRFVALAEEVTKEYEDAADWKDARLRIRQMGHDALTGDWKP